MTITRFAPSPTGYIHIGNVRSAIYPYLIAKQQRGKFILRIEDTDQARYVEGATDLIMETLQWLGLDWDEGPLKGGEHGPYFQSERKAIYRRWAEKLIDAGRAYADPTTPEQINQYRTADNAAKIPYLYRHHRPASADFTPEQTRQLWAEGAPLRFKSDPQEHSWHDEVMGDLHTGPEVCDDIVLIKKDGLPTYNFAHIVDDAEMGVTHILRGVEYLSSMPNYLSLYQALGLTPPKFLSLPHILAPQGNKKLSKRDGAKSVTDYRAEGILPEAMLNYLCCLGWNDGTEQEIYTRAELLDKFSIDRIQNSGARFDETKLLWMNGQWIRKIADEQGIKALYARTYNPAQDINFWPESANNYPDAYRLQVLAIIYDRLKTLADLRTMTDYFFTDPRLDLPLLVQNKFLKKLAEGELATLLTAAITKLQAIPADQWTATTLQQTFNDLLAETAKKPAEFFSLIRIALSFAPFSPALHLTAETLGRDRVLARLNAVRSALIGDHQ